MIFAFKGVLKQLDFSFRPLFMHHTHLLNSIKIAILK